MKYFDAVMDETLRMHPSAIVFDRVCAKDVTIEDSEGKQHKFRQGENVMIAPSGLHYDPKHFPNPYKFDPTRFLDKKGSNNPAYIPFGAGPRSCIGFRVAKMVARIMFFHISYKFNIECNSETPIPLKIENGSLFLKPVHEQLSLDFKLRQKQNGTNGDACKIVNGIP